MLGFVFLALRQAEGFAISVPWLPEQDLRVAGHTALSSRSFAERQPRIPEGGPHLVTDGAGLMLPGEGERDEEQHGRAHRSWRRLHLAVDAGAGEAVACVLTNKASDEAVR